MSVGLCDVYEGQVKFLDFVGGDGCCGLGMVFFCLGMGVSALCGWVLVVVWGLVLLFGNGWGCCLGMGASVWVWASFLWSRGFVAVAYTLLTLPTNREV